MSSHAERSCPREEEAVAWALHALEPDEELQFRQHLSGCASCQAAVRDAEEVLTGLGASVEQVAPPPALRDTLLARAAETPQQHDSPPPAPDNPQAPAVVPQRTGPRPAPTRWLPRRGRQLTAAALALVAVVAIGGLAVRNAQLQQQRDAEAAQSQRVTDLLRELARPGTQHALLSTDDGTTVAAVVVADGQRQIYTVGMPPNEADSTTYVLWGVPSGAAPQALGTFDVTGTGAGPATVGSGGEADRFTAYAISLEQGRAAPASPSAVMAQGQVAI